jgi:type VI secretion system protein VasD
MRVAGKVFLVSLGLGLAVVPGVPALVGCSSVTVPKETPACTLQVVGLTVIASPMLNPEVDGAPRPVQLRLYQLKTDTRIENASFDEIWKDDKNTLQDDLVKVDELPIYPDTRTEVKFERDPSALFVVGVALFREPKGRTWWTEFELPPPPGKGSCMFPDAKCSGEGCPKDAGTPEGGAPPRAPHFAIWMDHTRIDDGSDHLDEFPSAGRVREVFLHFSAPSGSPSPAPPPAAAPSGAAGGAPP